ncbi:unnamed protein product [Schistosoma curassoni]|nr:unnamed protein product [Schistosoma curassoni]
MIYEFFNAIVPFPKQYKKFTTFTREPSKYLDNDYSFFFNSLCTRSVTNKFNLQRRGMNKLFCSRLQLQGISRCKIGFSLSSDRCYVYQISYLMLIELCKPSENL